MKNNIQHLGLIAVIVFLISYGCKKDTTEIYLSEPNKEEPSVESTSSLARIGKQLPDFPGEARKYALSFSIGNKLYFGFGYNSSGPLNDLWEWNYDIASTDRDLASNNSWTKLSDFPRSSSGYEVTEGATLGFAVNGKGYIFHEAHTETGKRVNEFWEFDPQTNSWTRKADTPATLARSSAAGFVIGTKLYMGTGETGQGQWTLYKDFWQWDQATDLWTPIADFPGEARAHATGFSIGNKGYVGLGGEIGMGGGPVYKDFWEYDPSTDQWTRKADFTGTQLIGAIGFSVANKGYMVAGWDPFSESTTTQEIWEWNQLTDSWSKTGIFAGPPRIGAVGGSIGNKGYLLTGEHLSSEYITNPDIKDFWIFDLTCP